MSEEAPAKSRHHWRPDFEEARLAVNRRVTDLVRPMPRVMTWLYDVSGKEVVDLVYDSRVFHDCYDSIVKSTTESCQYSEMLHIYAASAALSVRVNSYFPPQPRGANFEADMLSHIIRRLAQELANHLIVQIMTIT